MNRAVPLTRQVHERLAEIIGEGDLVVDATVGNGHDTLFLARQVGPTGHVWGFDVQPQALDNTRAALSGAGLLDRVTLIAAGHETLADALPADAEGSLAAVTFNLGYLPGSDKQVTTLADTTLPALAAAMDRLRPGGVLSILAYRGHAGGQTEQAAVHAWLQDRIVTTLDLAVIASPGPVLYWAAKRQAG